jgi:hypothetical protein
MNQRFEYIQRKLHEAKQAGNQRAIKTWRTKLNQWQQEYGAYAPMNYTGFRCEL